jgi:hypothetical protein
MVEMMASRLQSFCPLLCSPSAFSGVNHSSVIPVNRMARLQGQNLRKRIGGGGGGGEEEENITARGRCGGMSIWDSFFVASI